jgi:putative nucleotidyltransferase with HDIG domain
MDERFLENIRKWFGSYVKRYCPSDGKLHAVLQLKVDHSARVAMETYGIAHDLGWSAADCHTARALGLLHDIGRFEQFTKFGTFLDPKSVDHGELGYEVASTSDVLAHCSASEKEIILTGIRYHNRRVVPSTLSADVARFVKLVRDADKVDIIFIINDEMRRNRHKEYPEILLGTDMNGPPTPALIKQIREQRSASYENVRSLADMNLIRMAWVYDINYLPALRRISERKLLGDLLKMAPIVPTSEMREIMNEAERHIEEQIAIGKMELH